MGLETITANFAPQARRETRGGREFLVSPVSMIVPGVLNGSEGALFYPLEELQKSPNAWNSLPITLGHPSKDGKQTSGRSRDSHVIHLGTVENSAAVGKLSAEAWIDVQLAQAADSRIVPSILRGDELEISTGLFTDNENADEGAQHNGVPYTKIARNYRPDHLAILLDQKGACSVDDGCGLGVNQRKLPSLFGTTGETRGHYHSVLLDEQGYGWAEGAQGHIHEVAAFKVAIQKHPEEVADGHTHSLTRTALVDIGFQTNRTRGVIEMKNEDRKKIVDLLVNSCCWEEKDRLILNSLPDENLELYQLKLEEDTAKDTVLNAVRIVAGVDAKMTLNQLPDALKKAIDAKAGDDKDDDEDEEDVKAKNKKGKATENAPPKWEDIAPAEVLENLKFAENAKTRIREAIVGRLVADVAPDKKVAQTAVYNVMSLEQLQTLDPGESESQVGPTDWTGNVGTGTPTPVDNSSKLKPMASPTIDYSELSSVGSESK